MATKPGSPWVDGITGGGKPRLLLFDDDALFLKACELSFKKKGFDVLAVRANGESFDEIHQLEGMIRGYRPSAIVTDFDMHCFEGIDVMREAKRLRPDLPVFLLSGNDNAQRAASGQGFDGVADKANPVGAVQSIVDMLAQKGITASNERPLP